MFTSLALKLLPYKTMILAAIIIIIIGSSVLYVRNLQNTNDQLVYNNKTLIENNEILSVEKVKWVNAMQEQVEFASKLEQSKKASDRSRVSLRNKLKKLKISVSNLNKSSNVEIDTDNISKEFTNQLKNSYNCISNASGYTVACDE